MYDPLDGHRTGYDLSNLSVLLIDDNEFTRRLFTSILGSLNIRRIHTADDGASGYKMFCASAIDLIIVDWEMEPVNGLAFVKRVRLDDDSPNRYVPIMMITAHTELNSVMMARDCGVNEFVAKPISAAQIYDRMVRILEASRPFVKTATYFGPDRRRRKDPRYTGEERRKKADPTKKAG